MHFRMIPFSSDQFLMKKKSVKIIKEIRYLLKKIYISIQSHEEDNYHPIRILDPYPEIIDILTHFNKKNN